MDRFTSVPRGDLAAAIYPAIGRGVETLFDNSISAISERATSVLVSFEHGPGRQFDERRRLNRSRPPRRRALHVSVH
jgi:hypothetical protein